MLHPATLGRAFRAATSTGPHSWVAVSPNETEGSTLAHVPGQLASAQMKELRNDTPGGEDGLGVWADGGEAVRYVPHADLIDGARWGLKMKQKAILHWQPDGSEGHVPPGAQEFAKRAVEYVAHVPVPPSAAVKHFQAHGLNYLTVVPADGGSRVHVVDEGGALRTSFHRAAGDSPVTETPGTATFLGDWDDRDKGAVVFHRILGTTTKLSKKPEFYVAHHFTSSTSAPEVTLDPEHGHNPWTQADYKAWKKRRVFFYLNPDAKEGFFHGAKSHYVAHIPSEHIYDMDENPVESMAALHALPEKYHGVKYDNTIQMFHPVTARLM